MTVGIAGKVSKQPSEIKEWVIDLEDLFSNRDDTPVSVELQLPELEASAWLESGNQIVVRVAGGVHGGDYGGTAYITTSSGLLEEIDFAVKVRETAWPVSEVVEHVAAKRYSEIAQDAADVAVQARDAALVAAESAALDAVAGVNALVAESLASAADSKSGAEIAAAASLAHSQTSASHALEAQGYAEAASTAATEVVLPLATSLITTQALMADLHAFQ